MKNFDIKRNKEPLTEADIAKGQDFESFMNAYTAAKPSFFKTTKFYAMAAGVAVVATVGTWWLMRDDHPAIAEEPASFITPLFADAALPDSSFTVNAADGGVLINENGSLISVPANAFLDSSGKIVSGNVELHYREFSDVAKIFMAGIPMTYDSAGTTYHFESAGMIDISAWQNGQPLKTNPDALIHVAMVTTNSEPRFNTYYLDTAAQNWEYRDNEEPIVLCAAASDTGQISEAPLPEPPVAPRIADKAKPSFAISFDPAEFPELVAYKGVRFEVDESQTPYDKNDKKVAWEDVSIERMKKGDLLQVTFTAGMKEAQYVTYPVVDSKDFATAKAAWEKRNAEYLALKQQREQQEQQQLEQEQQAAAQQKWINDSLAGVAMKYHSAKCPESEGQQLVMREFIIADFGIWNADCPLNLPDGLVVNARMLDQNGAALDAHMFYLVEKGRNVIYRYTDSTCAHFGFNPAAENMLWCVTRDGKLATVPVDEFKAATAGGKKDVTFKFNVQPEKLNSSAEARTILDIPASAGF